MMEPKEGGTEEGGESKRSGGEREENEGERALRFRKVCVVRCVCGTGVTVYINRSFYLTPQNLVFPLE